jgi:hypothetical protein
MNSACDKAGMSLLLEALPGFARSLRMRQTPASANPPSCGGGRLTAAGDHRWGLKLSRFLVATGMTG